MKAYDIVFESGGNWFYDVRNTKPVDGDVTEAGWMGTDGPAVGEGWPRGPLTGRPMAHVLTLQLPEEYRTQGPDLVAISFFQGEGQFAEEDEDRQPDDPFVISVAEARPRPHTKIFEDIIGGRFALVWLTAEEFAAGPTPPPEDVRREGEHEDDDGGANAWDDLTEFLRLGLTHREDPNAGKAPEEDSDDYVDYWDSSLRRKHDWAEPLFARCHLGGTTFPVQGMPRGLTATYFELEEIGPMNLGGGALQCDLASDTFDWACG